jgi:hypothetical protein
LPNRALDLFLADIEISQATSRDQGANQPAPVRLYVKRRKAKAPISSRAAGADSTGREGHARVVGGLPLTMTRALGLLA